VSVPPAVLSARYRAELLFDRARVVEAIDRLAVRLTVALADENPLLMCVMNGGLPFTGALMCRLQFPLELTYVHVGRYGNTTSGSDLIWYAKPQENLTGRHLVLLDDIVDHGVTLQCLVDWAEQAGVRAVTTAALLDKQIDGDRTFQPDYAALHCSDRYVFGWGMDYQGYWRNLPDIHALPAGES